MSDAAQLHKHAGLLSAIDAPMVAVIVLPHNTRLYMSSYTYDFIIILAHTLVHAHTFAIVHTHNHVHVHTRVTRKYTCVHTHTHAGSHTQTSSKHGHTHLHALTFAMGPASIDALVTS